MATTTPFQEGKKYYRHHYNPSYVETLMVSEIHENHIIFFSNIDGEITLPATTELFDTKEEARDQLIVACSEFEPDHDIRDSKKLIQLLYKYAYPINEVEYEPFYSVLIPEKIKEFFGVDVKVDEKNEEYVEWKEQNLSI